MSNNYKLDSQHLVSATPMAGASSGSRTLQVSLQKNQHLILPYYPSILETFKLKLSTYFGMLMLSYLIFRGLLSILVSSEALECHETSEIPK